MSKNAYFVSSNDEYHVYARMCVNSLIANTSSDIIWFQMSYENHDIQSPKLKYINVDLSQYDDIYDQYFNCRGYKICDRQIHTSARFIQLDKVINSGQYDNICLLDADMLIVNQKMDDIFNLVHQTNHLVCANEDFKWVITYHYTCNGAPIFDRDTRLMNFSCSVPLFFNCNYMKDFCKQFLYYFTHSKQHQPGQSEKDVDDMFIYNIVLQKMGKAKNIFLFPAQVFTQTHMDGYMPWNHLVKFDNTLYVNHKYLPVLSLHGRLIDQSYRQMIEYEVRKSMSQLYYTEQIIDGYMPILYNTLAMVQEEFRKYE